jgi:hypothetical protein
VTRRYSQTNHHDVLYTKAREYPGGVEALAQRMGKKSADILYNKLRPTCKTHHVTDEEFPEMLELFQGAKVDDWAAPLHALNWRLGHIAIEVPRVDDETTDEQLTAMMCRVMKEVGDVAAEVAQAVKDNRITPAEFDALEQQFMEALTALTTLRSRIHKRKGQA